MIHQTRLYYEFLIGRSPKGEPTEQGNLSAALRKAAGFSQVEVVQFPGIPQRTVSLFQSEARYLPSNLVDPLAKETRMLPRPKQIFIAPLFGRILPAGTGKPWA